MVAKGQKINDRYEIIKIIGEGGMANVYLAEDTILGRKVAVKVLRGDLATDDKFVRRFQREALAASSLNHPNIVEMYDVGEDNGDFYIVMEYVEGKNLKQLIKKRGNLTMPEVVDIMLQLTDGLSHAHDAYIIHRDIKPQNILILDNGLVKITDFGIAMALNSSQLTQTNSVMGSVHYLPPEQAAGKGSTIRSDIYSLGILMYELLTGKLPFKGENAVEIALKHMRDPLPSLRKELDSVPQSIENIIIKSTAKNPKNRYSSAREMYDDLTTVLEEKRANEPRYVYKHLEQDLEDTKVMPTIKDDGEINNIVKPIPIEGEKKPHKKLFFILGGIVAFLLILVFSIFMIYPAITRVPDIKVPNVVDMSISKAEKKLKDAGFKVAVQTKEVESDTIDKGNVVKTSPSANRLIKKGTTITIYESIGVDYIVIEDYTGKDFTTVKSSLVSLGLKVNSEAKSVDNIDAYRDKANIIVGQDLVAGTKLRKDDDITLYLPDIYDVYPDMVALGYSLSEAQAFADKYDIDLQVTYEETSEYDPGVVIYQSRKVNDKVTNGIILRIKIAKAVTVIEPSTEEEPV